MSDVINRDFAVMAIEQWLDHDGGWFDLGLKQAVREIKRLPSADRPSGKWIPFEYGDDTWHKCSVCGTADKYIRRIPRPNGSIAECVSIRNYCPNCGARMKGADDE